jgi:hypothetical protein
LGEISHEDEVKERVQDIMHSSAGVFQYMGEFEGEATCDNWVRNHGAYTSVKDVLATGEWAAYFLVTKRKITSGEEIKCCETTLFMSDFQRDPLWRIETYRTKTQMFGRPGIGPRPKHIDEERDLRLFRREEAKTVVHSYLLAKCVTGYDATSLERCLQRYIEEMGLPHGICLHQKVGAGSQLEYGTTNPATTWVALSLIRVASPKFAEVDPVDPTRSPPLTGCQVTSFDGTTTYDVSVRGPKQKFQDTKSVIEDDAKIAAERLQKAARHKKRKADTKKRKADAISTSEDDESSE